MRRFLSLLFGGFVLVASAQTGGELSGDYTEAYYPLNRLNAGLSSPQDPINLQTPQAALEHFVLESRNGDFASAARALNLNLLPENEQAARAPDLAEHLYFVLDKKSLINWDEVADRPDAQVEPIPGGNNPLAGQPRRSVSLGVLELTERDVAVRLQRVRVGEGAPLWVFSANTVENIPALFDQFGPGPIDRALPDWLNASPFLNVPLWEWGALLLLLVLCALVGWLTGRLSERIAQGSAGVVRDLAGKFVRPVAFAVTFGLLFTLTSGGLFLTGAVLGVLRPIFWVLFVASLTWVGMRVISLLAQRFEGRSEAALEHDSYDAAAQRRLTTLSVARQMFILLAVLLGLGIGLSQFASLELLGTTLLTSAGIASVILGVAAQPVLSNMVASVQVAITQPVRIGDSVLIADNWGYIEDLRYTYATVRTWDQRRVVLPLRYLVTEPYENWTLKDTHIIKPIYLYTDYSVDVGKIRDKFATLLEASDEWDERQDPSVQVTSVSDESVELRALCSAKTPAAAWTLHCKLREDLVAYVQGLENGDYLPKRRLAVQEAGALAGKARPGSPTNPDMQKGARDEPA